MKVEKVERERSNTLNMRIDPKMKYLATLASREQGRTLSGFIEWAIRTVLTDGALMEEPKVTSPMAPKAMRGETFWDVDEADRFYKLASARPGLLTIPEQRLWKLFNLHMEHTKRKPTVAAFREFWNDPSINTSHLKDGE
ncbi:MAG: hypothetical protein WBW84_13575 [Acidobacteriaceae bacterium]